MLDAFQRVRRYMQASVCFLCGKQDQQKDCLIEESKKLNPCRQAHSDLELHSSSLGSKDLLFLVSMGELTGSISEKLDKDTITHVLSLLDTSRDLAYASCVCRSWRRYVSDGNLWKRMCLKIFPEVGEDFKCLNSGDCSDKLSVKHSDDDYQSEHLEAGSSVYGTLLRRFQSPPVAKTCICEPLHASSTDNLPHESVAQTLYPEPVYPDEETPSYWSSRGQRNRDTPETLTYRLVSDLCVIHSVKVQPFLAFFQPDDPIYSSRMVRFRFGYSRSPRSRWSGLFDCLCDMPQGINMDDYVWTYVSPTFPMAQEDTLQTFELPKPTLCIGSVFQIEFIGRVQTQQIDSLYYICISHVHVTGRPLGDFKFRGIDEKGHFVFKHIRRRDTSDSVTQTLGVGGSSSPTVLEQNDAVMSGAYVIEQIRTNRLALRNRLVLDTLLRNLLAAGLLSHDEELLEDSA